jgi:cbb3-type cytochrome oxidase maturation protein
MNEIIFLLPLSLLLGLLALAVFLWALRSDQYDDLDGSAERILHTDDKPIVDDDCLSSK